MTQHQRSFLADRTDEVAQVARHALSLLTSRRENPPVKMSHDAPVPMPQSAGVVAAKIFKASYGTDPSLFAKIVMDVRSAGNLDDVLEYEMLPAAARQLGRAWEDDHISFADVTIGCARLSSALRQLPDNAPAGGVTYQGTQQNCLVMVLGGAQHTMGALVLTKRLRQARQRVVVELEADPDKLALLAPKHTFDAVLISASGGMCTQELRQVVNRVRQIWSDCKVIIGGSICEPERDLAARVGADLATSDWQVALDHCI